MRIHTLRALQDNFIYVLEHESRAAVLDPGEAAPVREFLSKSGLKLSYVLCTHHHRDHIGGVSELPAPRVLSSAYDRARIPEANFTAEGEIEVLGQKVAVIPLPGHTHGQIAFHFYALKTVFVGDTLFSAGCGRLFEGTASEMYESLKRLRSLPPETRVYFGHEYTRRNLEFVRLHAPKPSVDEYTRDVEARLAAGEDTTPTTIGRELDINPFFYAANLEEFTRLRRLRDHF